MKGITINTHRREIFRNGKRVDTTPKEFRVIETLFLNRDRAMTREELFLAVWPDAAAANIETRTMDQHVARARKKVGSEVIETVRDFGYRISESVTGS